MKINHLIILGLLTVATSLNASDIALTITNTSGGTTNTSGWSSGFAFTVTETISVTELGKFDHEGDGLGGTDVGLYNVGTGALLTSVSLVGASFELTTGPRAYFATLTTPVELVTGTEYAIMAVTNSGENIVWGRGSTFASEITLVQGRANLGSTLTGTYAQSHTLGGDAYSGGTFKYNVSGTPVGNVDVNVSTVAASPLAVPADGTTTSTITVTLMDSNSLAVANKTVSLAGSPAGASITPVSPTTNASGQATFTVSSGSSGTVVFTATDETDSLVLSNTASVNFEELVVGPDTTLPTLASTDIVDDQPSGSVGPGSLVNYTITFSEDIAAATVTSSDFGDAGGDVSLTFGAITETSPGVFNVEVTPTTNGTLNLQVNQNAEILDTSGNALDTTAAIVDDTSILVEPNITALTLVNVNIGSTTSGLSGVLGTGADSWTATTGADNLVDSTGTTTTLMLSLIALPMVEGPAVLVSTQG